IETENPADRRAAEITFDEQDALPRLSKGQRKIDRRGGGPLTRGRSAHGERSLSGVDRALEPGAQTTDCFTRRGARSEEVGKCERAGPLGCVPPRRPLRGDPSRELLRRHARVDAENG